MEQRISLISLGTYDLKRANTFYENMGWKIYEGYKSDTIAFYQMNGFVLGIYPLKELEKHENANEGTLKPNGALTLGINTRNKEEVDEICRAFSKNGGKVTTEPETTPWGSYTAYAEDPDGHVWEISYMESMLPDKDGHLLLKL